MEKLKPAISKSSISSLRFQSKPDFDKFLKFIKKETKDLKDIETPKDGITKKVIGAGAAGLGLLGLSLLFKGKGTDSGGEGDDNFTFAVGREDDTLPRPPFAKPKPKAPRTFRNLTKRGTRTFSQRGKMFKRLGGRKEATRLRNKQFVTSSGGKMANVYGEVGGDSANRKLRGKDIDRTNRIISEKKRMSPMKRLSPLNRKIFKSLSDEEKAANRLIKNLTKKSGGKSGKIGIIPDPEGEAMRKQRIKDNLQLEKQQRDAISNQKMKNLVEAESGTKIRDFKPTTPDESKLGEGRTIKKRYRGRVKNRDVVLRSGVRGFSKPDPFNRFGTVSNPIMSKNPFKKGALSKIFNSKVTKDTFLKIPTKGKFFTKAGMFFNHPIPKGISFLITAYDAYKEGESIVKVKDNIFTALYDLGVAINNELFFPNDMSKHKLYITESSNDKIKAHKNEKNNAIKEFRNKVSSDGGGTKILIAPTDSGQNNTSSNNIPSTSGGDKVSFIPMEPLNIGEDILLYKLNA